MRRQFDRPIGSFQAIKHRCAEMAVELDAARAAVLSAATSPPPARRSGWPGRAAGPGHGGVEIMRSCGHQALTRFLRGEFPLPEATINKIVWSEFFQRETELALEMLGADALTPTGPGSTGSSRVSTRGRPTPSARWWSRR